MLLVVAVGKEQRVYAEPVDQSSKDVGHDQWVAIDEFTEFLRGDDDDQKNAAPVRGLCALYFAEAVLHERPAPEADLELSLANLFLVERNGVVTERAERLESPFMFEHGAEPLVDDGVRKP